MPKTYPPCTVMCLKCDDVTKTTLQVETVPCRGCGEILQVRLPGDKKLIARWNDKSGKRIYLDQGSPAMQKTSEVGEAVAAALKNHPCEKPARKAGATKVARDYYTTIEKKLRAGTISRKDAILGAIALGVNKGTASVQLSKFMKG